jgi:predicted permease
MKRLRQLFRRLTTSVTRRRDEQRLREELEDHLALETEAHSRQGLPPDEARRRARVAFGSIEAFKEAYRDQQGLPVVEHLLQDVRIAFRRMRAAPGFTVAAVATLALGFGLTSAILSLAYALFFRPLPVDDPSRLAIVDQTLVNRPITAGYPFSFADYEYYRDHTRTFHELAAHYSTSPMNVVTPAGPLNLLGSVVTSNYFSVLRLQPALGRFFSADEDRVPGRNPVTVLGHDLWRTKFDADAGILGATVRINGTDFTVIGIAPATFHGTLSGLEPNGVWIPSAMFGVGYRYCDWLTRACKIVNLIGRLANGKSIDEAQSELDVMAQQPAAAFSDTNAGRGVHVRTALGIRIEEQAKDAPIVALLAGAAVIVLLVASANVAGLLLARGLNRRREIAVRLALGASRDRLVRLLLVESITLATIGGVAGLAVAVWSTELLRTFFGLGPGGALNLDLSLDLRVAMIGLGIAFLTGVITGIVPALQATRPDQIGAIKEETAGAGTRRSKWRETLIVAQVALSVMLLGGSGLLVRSFVMLHRGPGFDPKALAFVRLRPSLVGYSNERAWAFQRDVIARLEAMPGIVAASPAVVPPFPGWGRPTQPIQLPGETVDPSHRFQAPTTFVGPRYFKTLGASVAAGREFDDRDTADSARVALVNETLAGHFWPKGGAVGSRLQIGAGVYDVVGIVKDLQWLSALDRPDPIAYLNYWQQDRSNSWSQDSRTHIRVSGDASVRLREIQRALAAIDPDVPITTAQTFDVSLDSQFVDVRAAKTMLVTFGVLALGLSMIGLYAALAFSVAQRAREVAVRMALGASRSDVGRLIFGRGAAIVLAGLVAGLVFCVIGGPFLAHLLYGVNPRDPLALATGPAILAAAAMLAIWLPARRAMSQDPIVALRME